MTLLVFFYNAFVPVVCWNNAIFLHMNFVQVGYLVPLSSKLPLEFMFTWIV
jgi:hypothetical protein